MNTQTDTSINLVEIVQSYRAIPASFTKLLLSIDTLLEREAEEYLITHLEEDPNATKDYEPQRINK